MRRSAVLILFCLTAVIPHSAVAVEPRPTSTADVATIPLGTIWASYMPGTKDINTLEPEVFSSTTNDLPANERDKLARESMINRIGAKLQPAPNSANGPVANSHPRRSTFAVLGNGRAALKAASEIFDKGVEPNQSFPVGSEISVVFFSYQAGSRVEIVGVDVIGQTINIRYRFNADGLLMSTSHIALIPLKGLEAGKYQVTFTQLPLTGRNAGKSRGQLMHDWEAEVICKPFSFVVSDKNPSQ